MSAQPNFVPNSNAISFEQLANATVRSTMEGSDTPFRDAVKSAFNLAQNTLATADALVCGIRYYAEDWKHESANEFIMKSAKLDERATTEAMKRKLRNIELANAMRAVEEAQQEATA